MRRGGVCQIASERARERTECKSRGLAKGENDASSRTHVHQNQVEAGWLGRRLCSLDAVHRLFRHSDAEPLEQRDSHLEVERDIVCGKE